MMTHLLSIPRPSTLMLLVACSAALCPSAARAAIPERSWGTYIGEASDTNSAGRVALDAAGNIYVAGYTSIAGIATPGAHKPQPGLFAQDGYLMKFDPAGERIWGTYFGGPEPERIDDLAVGGDRVVFCGYTGSDEGIASPGAFQTTRDPQHFGARYVAAFSTDGAWLWGTYINVIYLEGTCSVAIGPDDTVYVAAAGNGDDNLATPGAHQTAVAGGVDAYLLHLGPAGERLWGTYYGGIDADRLRGIASDALGGVYITGETRSASGIASPGAHQPVHGGVEYHDMFLARFTDGALDWGTYLGGELPDLGTAVAPHPDGGVVLTGYTYSPGLATPGTHQQAPFGAEDGLLTRFDGAGTRLWSTYFGGQNPDYPRDVVTTPDGAVYLAGETYSSAVIATPDAFLSVFQGPTDAFLARFTGTGTLQWATYYGGPPGVQDGHEFTGEEFAVNVATRGDDRVVLAGGTLSIQGIATPGSFTPTFEGVGLAAFVAVFTEMPAEDESSTGATSDEMTGGTATTDLSTDTAATTGTTGEIADTADLATSSTSDGEPAPTSDGPTTYTTAAHGDASATPAQTDDPPADGCTCTTGRAAPGGLLSLFVPLLLRRRCFA